MLIKFAVMFIGLLAFRSSFAQQGAPSESHEQKVPLYFINFASTEAFDNYYAQTGGINCHDKEKDAFQKCIEEKLKKSQWEIKLQREPKESSEVIGKIVIKAVRQGLSVYYSIQNGPLKELPMEMVDLHLQSLAGRFQSVTGQTLVGTKAVQPAGFYSPVDHADRGGFRKA